MKLRNVPVYLLVMSSLIGAVPTHAAALQANDLIKGPGDAVYYYAPSLTRYVFPTYATYATWYDDFSGIKTLSAEELSSIPIGGSVTFKPGTRLVKVTTDPKVYAVDSHGVLRWIVSETVAKALYGEQWNTMVSDVPDAFFTNYTIGNPIQKAEDFDAVQEQISTATIAQDKGLEAAEFLDGSKTTPVSISNQETVVVALPDPGDGGYQFDQSSLIHTGFRLLRTYHVISPASIMPGDFGKQVWVFQATQEGTGEITITSSRSWETGKAIESFHSQFQIVAQHPI